MGGITGVTMGETHPAWYVTSRQNIYMKERGNNMSNTWSRKTYELVADIIHEAYKDRDMVNIWDLMQRFGVEFKMDNSRFDEERFRKACIGPNLVIRGDQDGT